MAEMGDAGVAAGEIAHARKKRPRQDLDLIAGGVLSGDEGIDPALLAFLLGAQPHREIGVVELRSHLVEIVGMLQFEADDVVGGIAFEISERVVARVAAGLDPIALEIGPFAILGGQFQSHDLGRKRGGGFQIARAQTDIADVVQMNHDARTPKFLKLIVP